MVLSDTEYSVKKQRNLGRFSKRKIKNIEFKLLQAFFNLCIKIAKGKQHDVSERFTISDTKKRNTTN